MMKVVDPYIWERKNSFTDEFCDKLISKFEENPGDLKIKGKVGGGTKEEVKNTWDIYLDNIIWADEDKTICKILTDSISEYASYLKEHDSRLDPFNSVVHFSDSGYNLQMYEPNKGFYTWHDDYRFEKDFGSRILTFMWYLNTVEEGGQTEFSNGIKINAEKGKLVMFPSTWTYTHRGCMPISNSKYILTGWIYNGWKE